MEFNDRIRSLTSRILANKDSVQTEEATKTALIMPFMDALGYNVFDPKEVTPELIADIGTKKGEKVDYAILKDGKPIMIFECKKAGSELGINHASQLFRYFSVTDTRFAILTNGILYQFFTDLEQQNKMDEKPFFEFNVIDFQEQDLEELVKFAKDQFDTAKILNTASDLKYLREIQKVLSVQLNTPSEDFVKVIAGRIYPGKFTQQIRDQFAGLVRRAFNQMISDRIQERLKAAMVDGGAGPTSTLPEPSADENNTGEQIITTPEEFEAFFIIRAILREVIPAKRITLRDAKSYCAILFDDNNRKPICRLYFNSIKKKSIGFFNADKSEDRIVIHDLDDIYKFVKKIQDTVMSYIGVNETLGI